MKLTWKDEKNNQYKNETTWIYIYNNKNIKSGKMSVETNMSPPLGNSSI